MSDKVHSQILRMLSKKRQLAAKTPLSAFAPSQKRRKQKPKEDNYGIFYQALLAAQTKKIIFVLFLKIKKEDGKFTYAAINERLVACEKIGCTIQQNF